MSPPILPHPRTQPWHWDNTKCLVIFTFCAAGYVGALLDWLLRVTGNAAGRPWFPAAVLVATAPPPLSAVARASALSVVRAPRPRRLPPHR